MKPGYLSPTGKFLPVKDHNFHQCARDICNELGEEFDTCIECMDYIMHIGYLEVDNDNAFWLKDFKPTEEQVKYIVRNKKGMSEGQYIAFYDVVAKFGDIDLIRKFINHK